MGARAVLLAILAVAVLAAGGGRGWGSARSGLAATPPAAPVPAGAGNPSPAGPSENVPVLSGEVVIHPEISLYVRVFSENGDLVWEGRVGS
jgi:hypothetical protein